MGGVNQGMCGYATYRTAMAMVIIAQGCADYTEVWSDHRILWFIERIPSDTEVSTNLLLNHHIAFLSPSRSPATDTVRHSYCFIECLGGPALTF